jgi:hypothetical protein
MIKIQDVTVPTKGVGKYLNVRVLNFDLEPTNGITLYWAIHDETEAPDETEGAEEGATVLVPGKTLLDGNLSMDQATYNDWGVDDSYVTDWALTELNLTKA